MKQELTKELEQFLVEKNGYFNLREIPGRGVCGLGRMLFTTGLFYGLDFIGRKGRYCYKNLADAKEAIEIWDGTGHPPGEWIKHKGDGIDEGNPNQENRK